MLLRITKNLLLSGIPFGLAIYVISTWLNIPYPDFIPETLRAHPVFLGTIAGLLFGLILVTFTEWMAKQLPAVQSDSLPGERILRSGLANHVLASEAVGGWLLLSDSTILFKSHGMNMNNDDLRIALVNVLDVSRHLSAGFIPNGLRISTLGGIETFVVNGNRKWKRAITQAAANANARLTSNR